MHDLDDGRVSKQLREATEVQTAGRIDKDRFFTVIQLNQGGTWIKGTFADKFSVDCYEANLVASGYCRVEGGLIVDVLDGDDLVGCLVGFRIGVSR